MPGNVAIVTGGGTGIGRSAALALGREGYSVVIAGRRHEPLEQTVADAGAEGLVLSSMPTDVSDPADVRALFDAAVERSAGWTCCSTTPAQVRRAVPLEDLTLRGLAVGGRRQPDRRRSCAPRRRSGS